MIQLAKPWTFRRGSESKLCNGKPLVRTPKENAQLIDLEWTEEEQAWLKTMVDRYTSRGASGAWRVHRGLLASFALLLGDTEDPKDVSGQCYNEWPLNTSVESPIFRSLRQRLLPMLVQEVAEYPGPDQNDGLRYMLVPDERTENSLPSTPPTQKRFNFVLFLAKFVI
jgi:hypothetical protein